MAKTKVKLTAAELREYSDDLAKKVCYLQELQTQKADHNTAANREIKDLKLAIDKIAHIINEGCEEREETLFDNTTAGK